MPCCGQKVVVDEASILNIQALTKRRSPGYVVPPTPPGEGESVVDKARDQVLAQTRKQFNQNFLGDVAAVLGGVDPKEQLKNLQAELKSDARIKQLEKELAEKKLKWEKQIKDLPQTQELKQFETRVKALKFDVNNPAELAKNLKEADKIIKEADAKVKLIEQTSKDVNGDINTYSQAYKDLENMIQEDIRDLQTRLKLPKIDSKEFSQQLFMSMIESKLVSLQKYIAIARKYMPPKKTEAEKLAKQEEQIVPRRRGEGKNYRFPITTGYPLFWLKHAAISSELGTSELSGDIKGEILDLTTDQVFLKRPTKINLAGNFPKQNVHGVDARITLDHTTDQAKDGLVLKVAKFPSGDYMLSDSSDVKLGISDSMGSTQLVAGLVNQEITVDIKNQFNDIKYQLEAKNKHVQSIIDGILKDIPMIDLNASVRGSFNDFSLHINSNLGEELAKGFQKQLQAKLAEAQAQLRGIIDQRIGKERDKLKAEMDKTIGQLTKDLGVKKEEVDKVIREAKAQIEGEKGKGQGKKLEQEGKKLLKKFKLGGG
ncbi:MAG: TIGR03545 family protein [Bdellovibrionaceae bacterium]|nr:TIGR03545 family protein [Pseudobdellovibrionaceae bacterium]